MPRVLLLLLLSTLPLFSGAAPWPCDKDHSDQVRHVPDWLQRALPEYTLAHPDTTDVPVFYHLHTLGPFPTETRSIRLIYVHAKHRAALVHHASNNLLLVNENNEVLTHWQGVWTIDGYSYNPDLHTLSIGGNNVPLIDPVIDNLCGNPDFDGFYACDNE